MLITGKRVRLPYSRSLVLMFIISMKESYYSRHREKILEYQKNYYKEHKEERLERQTAYNKAWRENNKDKIRGYNKKYYSNNRERYLNRYRDKIARIEELEKENRKLKDSNTILKKGGQVVFTLEKRIDELLEENKKLKETIKDHQLYEEKLEHRIIEFEELLHGE